MLERIEDDALLFEEIQRMEPLWRVKSGTFAGWRTEDRLYDTIGVNIGFFVEDHAFTIEGKYLGQIFRTGQIGFNEDATPPIVRPKSVRFARISAAPFSDRDGISISGWSDPEF